MSPAIRVAGREGRVAAKTLTTARKVEPDSDPSAGWLVEQNYRITNGIVEGTLTIGLGKTGESGTAIAGERATGNVEGIEITTPRVVVGNEYLGGVIWVCRSERLGLGNVGKALIAGDQVHIRAAIHQGRHRLLDKLGKVTGISRFTSLGQAAE